MCQSDSALRQRRRSPSGVKEMSLKSKLKSPSMWMAASLVDKSDHSLQLLFVSMLQDFFLFYFWNFLLHSFILHPLFFFFFFFNCNTIRTFYLRKMFFCSRVLWEELKKGKRAGRKSENPVGNKCILVCLYTHAVDKLWIFSLLGKRLRNIDKSRVLMKSLLSALIFTSFELQYVF